MSEQEFSPEALALLEEFAELTEKVGELAGRLEAEHGIPYMLAAGYAARKQGIELPPMLSMILG